jgi:hypothetical protein
MPSDPPVTFFERQWVPLWVYLASFSSFFAFVLGIGLLCDLSGSTQPAMRSVFAHIVFPAAAGLSTVFFIWYSHVFRTITVDESNLMVTKGPGSVRLEDIAAVAVVRGSEVRQLRNDMSLALSPGGLLIPLGGALGAVGSAAVGVSALRSLKYARAMVASPWMHEAVVVFAPRDPTPLWLIGTRHPEELAAAIERGASLDESGP